MNKISQNQASVLVVFEAGQEPHCLTNTVMKCQGISYQNIIHTNHQQETKLGQV